jgi:hypothetical protein
MLLAVNMVYGVVLRFLVFNVYLNNIITSVRGVAKVVLSCLSMK